MKKVIYVHGKGGNAAEAKHYKNSFEDCEVVGFDYKSQSPWEARDEFPHFFKEQRKNSDELILVANSIGAFFSMSSLGEDKTDENLVDEAYFISPVVDMENLICNMMTWAGVTESELASRKEIPTNFGETLSWDYLCYVRNNPIKWTVKTHILYGEKDNLTSQSVITGFAEKIGASLEIMRGGEHWFHTDEQMKFLDEWITKTSRGKSQCLTIRKTTGKDVPLIHEFIKGLAKYEKRPQDVTGSAEMLKHWLFGRTVATAIIAEFEGEAVGYAIYYPVFGSFSAKANVHLEDLFIKPEYRRRGWGKEFFFKLCEMIKSEGYSELEWSCLDWNAPSIRFYEKIGATQEKGRVYFEYTPQK